MTWSPKWSKSQEKFNHLMYMNNIQPAYRNAIWQRKKCHAHNERWGKKGIELPNQKSIKTLGKKENNKYQGILKPDIIKQAEFKEKKSTSEE